MVSNILPLLSNVIKPDWTVTKDVAYGNLKDHSVDCYLLNSGVRPAVVFIHGGGWMSGDKSAYESTAKRYALAGYNVFAINYTLAKNLQPETQWDAQLKDVETFMSWLKKNAATLRIDPNRIVASGDSAGGHLALFLATSKNPAIKVLAVLNMYGPTDLSADDMRFTLSTTPVLNYTTDVEVKKAASPITYVDAFTSPICTIHGTKDTVVPVTQAEKLRYKLDSNRVYNEFYTYDGGHGWDKVPWYVQLYMQSKGLWFLNKFV